MLLLYQLMTPSTIPAREACSEGGWLPRTTQGHVPPDYALFTILLATLEETCLLTQQFTAFHLSVPVCQKAPEQSPTWLLFPNPRATSDGGEGGQGWFRVSRL